jgi:hypothetical protein
MMLGNIFVQKGMVGLQKGTEILQNGMVMLQNGTKKLQNGTIWPARWHAKGGANIIKILIHRDFELVGE